MQQSSSSMTRHSARPRASQPNNTLCERMRITTQLEFRQSRHGNTHFVNEHALERWLVRHHLQLVWCQRTCITKHSVFARGAHEEVQLVLRTFIIMLGWLVVVVVYPIRQQQRRRCCCRMVNIILLIQYYHQSTIFVLHVLKRDCISSWAPRANTECFVMNVLSSSN